MDPSAIGTIVTAVAGLLGVVFAGMNGRTKFRRSTDEEDAIELRNLRDWRIDCTRWWHKQAARFAGTGQELDELPDYPPVKPKRGSDE